MLALVFSLSLLTPLDPSAPPAPGVSEGFDVVALGVQGGLAEDDLTAFLISRKGRQAYLALDAGSVVSGLRRVPGVVPGHMLREQIRGWAITHPHLDHVEGLAIAVVDDAGIKPVFGFSPTIVALRDHVFNNVLWPNFGNEGNLPLRRLRYERMAAGRRVHFDDAGFTIEALPLSHGGVLSTAFLIGDGDDVVAFLGDTGPDLVEGGTRLAHLWERLAPLARGRKLRGLFIECSFPSARPDKLLFGHLTPRHLLSELGAFAALVDPQSPSTALNFPIVVMHIKPGLDGGKSVRDVVISEIDAGNKLGLRFLFPAQGDRFGL
ncbi:MAG: 3',5'-cyclic-nucleotide phosphodiesterase [Deltaproteobacteria bacterium]|nr:3',5'-cyclic-nucleotide phosphodiesterase [Deltaproteobacteria bacterium]